MSDTPKWTPGPWRVGVEVDSEPRLIYIRIEAGKRAVSSTGVYGHKRDGTAAGRKYTDKFGTERNTPVIPEDECRANARLIAAAPELYQALDALVDLVDREHGSLYSAQQTNALAALAKARGER